MTYLTGAAVIARVWARFLSAFPDVQLEVHADAAPGDLVAKGFDAGIGPKRLGGRGHDRCSGNRAIRVAVVGAPAYFARRHPPRTPDDLARHSCIQFRRAADGVMFAWTFERDGKSRQISVDGRVVVNNTDLAVGAAVDGFGSRTRPSCGRPVPALGGSWFACWRTARPPSRGSFFIIPAIGKCRSRRAPSSTCSAPPAGRHRPRFARARRPTEGNCRLGVLAGALPT